MQRTFWIRTYCSRGCRSRRSRGTRRACRRSRYGRFSRPCVRIFVLTCAPQHMARVRRLARFRATTNSHRWAQVPAALQPHLCKLQLGHQIATDVVHLPKLGVAVILWLKRDSSTLTQDVLETPLPNHLAHLLQQRVEEPRDVAARCACFSLLLPCWLTAPASRRCGPGPPARQGEAAG